jgi:hypothetical protein
MVSARPQRRISGSPQSVHPQVYLTRFIPRHRPRASPTPRPETAGDPRAGKTNRVNS